MNIIINSCDFSEFEIGDIVKYKPNDSNDWYEKKYLFEVISMDEDTEDLEVKCLQDIFNRDGNLWHRKNKSLWLPCHKFYKKEIERKANLPDWL